MMVFPETLIGCPTRTSYGAQDAPSSDRKAALKGRPRYELYDVHSATQVSVSFDMTLAQFTAWQSFWDSLGRGRDWFLMDLSLDALPVSQYEVHAAAPFSSTHVGFDHVRVGLNLEVLS